MPTVLRAGGFTFHFYSNDHDPAHVHCTNGDGTVLVRIVTAKAYHRDGTIRDRDIRRAEALVAEHCVLLLDAWENFAKKKGLR